MTDELDDLIARLQEETRLVETLHEVGRALAADLDLPRIVQTACDAATSLTGAAFGSFFYNTYDMNGQSYFLYVLSGVPREAFERFPMPRNTKVFDPTFQGEGVIRMHDVRADARYGQNPPYHGMPEGHLDVRSYLAVPVISPSGEVLGGFFFGHPEVGMFTGRHEQLASGVAAQAAVAMDNARLYQRHRDAAVELQRSLLSPLPRFSGLRQAWRYYPARGIDVGGDWVDLIPIDESRVALVVGDVMGKGIQAAAVMGQMRTAVRALAVSHMSPGEILRQAAVVLRAADRARLVTCLLAVYDTDAATLTWANAGQLPMLLDAPGGPCTFLDEGAGPPLGVVDYNYVEHKVAFPAGTRLLLYTDGLVERRDRPIDAGMARLKTVWRATRDQGDLDAVADRLVDALVDVRAHEDDIALLVVATS
ncbi:PP2C family protein-serine/threonine phosphatase [Herbidospora mongoliensis]|uniref:PP2C family protein-serine/threonine phosphatase n=1 Tax=Herbidospora mongoliensis TaxID=688067 RepID=UPI000833BFD8|nr:GAF domain-containing SpoIIE family protein phosphatase [Herbidospora mongoliensis]